MDYKIGDTVTYRTFMGGTRTVTVTNREDDVKNGLPGFDGIIEETGETVWGMDNQICIIVHN